MRATHLCLAASFLAVGTLPACATVPGAFSPAWTDSPNPSYYINSVATSADASRTVAGTFFHTYANGTGAAGDTGTFGTYCYDGSGHRLWSNEFQGWQGVYWVAISNDAAWAASGGWYSQSPYQGFVRAFNAATGVVALDYRTSARVNEVALSADGTWLVSGANSIVLFQRSGSTYSKMDEYTPPGSSPTIETLALSADGTHLVAAAYSGAVLLFNISNGKLGTPATWTLPGGGYSHCVRMTPDGSAFAVGGSAGSFYLCETQAFAAGGGPTTSYQVPNTGSVYGVAIADDASAYVGIANVSGSKGAVYFVNRSGPTSTLRWTCPTAHNPNCVSLNGDANVVAVADGHPDGTPGAFYAIDASSGTVLGSYTTSNMSWPIEVASKGNAIVAGSDNGTVYGFAWPQLALAKKR